MKNINLDLKLGDEPVILGFQNQSDYLMVPMKLSSNNKLEIINDHLELDRDICHKSQYHNRAVWTLDRTGRLFKVELTD
jgi:hypothetical protein